MRLEDISRNPVEQFHALFDRLGVPHDARVDAMIAETSDPSNPAEAPRRIRSSVTARRTSGTGSGRSTKARWHAYARARRPWRSGSTGPTTGEADPRHRDQPLGHDLGRSHAGAGAGYGARVRAVQPPPPPRDPAHPDACLVHVRLRRPAGRPRGRRAAHARVSVLLRRRDLEPSLAARRGAHGPRRGPVCALARSRPPRRSSRTRSPSSPRRGWLGSST